MADQKQLSTQQHLPFTAVFQDVMALKDGNFRQIVLVSSINFGLKNEDEQNAIVYAYQSFLNSLNFPIQILIQSRQIDLGQYIANLKQQIFQQSNELIRYQTQEYIDFISRLISVANIMDKKFFVVVPYQKIDIKKGLFAPKSGSLQVSISEFQKIKDELSKRVDVVEQGLAAMGLKSVVLNTEQIIELLYSSYNITQSLREKLQDAETLADSTVVQKDLSGATLQDNGAQVADPQAPASQYSTALPNPQSGYQQAPAPNQTTYNIPVQNGQTVQPNTGQYNYPISQTSNQYPQQPDTQQHPGQNANQYQGQQSQYTPAQVTPTNYQQGPVVDGVQPIQPIQ